MTYKTELWHRKTWHSATRYYHAEIKQDLFHNWLLEKHWSGLWQKGGRRTVEIVESLEVGLQKLRAIEKQRLAHGYHEITTKDDHD